MDLQMIDLTTLLQAVVSLAAAVVTAVVIPYIKSKTTTEQQTQLKSLARIGVAAAEQIFIGSGRGAAKREYVREFLHDKGFYLDPDTINAFIESEVNHLCTGEIIEMEDVQ